MILGLCLLLLAYVFPYRRIQGHAETLALGPTWLIGHDILDSIGSFLRTVGIVAVIAVALLVRLPPPLHSLPFVALLTVGVVETSSFIGLTSENPHSFAAIVGLLGSLLVAVCGAKRLKQRLPSLYVSS